MEHRIHQYDGTARKKTKAELGIEIQRVMQAVNEFPTLPSIYSNIIDIIASPDATAVDLSKIIEQDQSAVTKILKVANSPIYGISQRVTSLDKAIFFLGFNEIKNLMISLSLINLVNRSTNLSQSFNLEAFWKHTIAVGVIARQIGFYAKISNLDEFLLAGIVHDFGKLVFIKYFPAIYGRVSDKAFEMGLSISELEDEVFGISSEYAGSIISEKWNLPHSIKRAVRFHNTGISDVPNDYLTASVHLANIVARMMMLGNPGDNIVYPPNPKAVDLLALPDNLLTRIYPSIKTDFFHTTIALLN